MSIDRAKLQYYSGDQIDKVVTGRTQVSIYNDGNTGGSDNWQRSQITQSSYQNQYGKRCFVRGWWSIDGGNTKYSFDSHQMFSFNINLHGSYYSGTQTKFGLLAAVSIGVSDSSVVIRTANGHHGDISVNTDNGSQSYSAIPHTFLIEYELFEVS